MSKRISIAALREKASGQYTVGVLLSASELLALIEVVETAHIVQSMSPVTRPQLDRALRRFDCGDED